MAESRDILTGSLAGKTIGDGLIVLPGQGNSLAACTDDGCGVGCEFAPTCKEDV